MHACVCFLDHVSLGHIYDRAVVSEEDCCAS